MIVSLLAVAVLFSACGEEFNTADFNEGRYLAAASDEARRFDPPVWKPVQFLQSKAYISRYRWMYAERLLVRALVRVMPEPRQLDLFLKTIEGGWMKLPADRARMVDPIDGYREIWEFDASIDSSRPSIGPVARHPYEFSIRYRLANGEIYWDRGKPSGKSSGYRTGLGDGVMLSKELKLLRDYDFGVKSTSRFFSTFLVREEFADGKVAADLVYATFSTNGQLTIQRDPFRPEDVFNYPDYGYAVQYPNAHSLRRWTITKYFSPAVEEVIYHIEYHLLDHGITYRDDNFGRYYIVRMR